MGENIDDIGLRGIVGKLKQPAGLCKFVARTDNSSGNPDLELKWGGGWGGGVDLITLLTFLPSVISSFLGSYALHTDP